MTTGYQNWPTKDVPVSQLRLDPLNPRLNDPSEENDQRAILRELIEHEEVEKLASDIARQGFFPTETMLVLKESPTRYVVMEGNRRTAALKALLNPQAAPALKKSRFEVLQREGVGRIPTDVRATIAPSRVAARPIILSRHTTSDIKKWRPVSQARYIDTMVSEGYSPAEIAREMGLSLPTFLRRFRDAKLHQLALSLTLDPEIREIVADPRKFSLSPLQRIAAGWHWWLCPPVSAAARDLPLATNVIQST
jgi:ParB-like chromosome segregation protein Spo0J